MQEHAPQFLILEERGYRSFADALGALWERDSVVQPIGLDGPWTWPRQRRAVPGVVASLLLHFAVGFFLIRMPWSMLLRRLGPPDVPSTSRIVYVLHPLTMADYYPVLKPPGPGGKPGKPGHDARPLARGADAYHPKLTIVSNPPHPDNNRQTIRQPASPPALKIPVEVRLPNIVAGLTPPPAPPTLMPQKPVFPTLPPTPAKPVTPAPTLALALPANPVSNPLLPVPAPAPPAPSKEPDKPMQDQALADLGAQASDKVAALLSVSVDPAASAGAVALPPGNREGAFSISPAGGRPGSPGGAASGTGQGGSGGTGAGGDGSTGVGGGSSGGGGGAQGIAAGTVSISGGSGGAGSGGVLPSFFASTLVYPVSLTRTRRPAMVVTAGPAGGGGLHVYGVLKGGKIYTIYLPMPGKSWVLQYCALDGAEQRAVDPHNRVEVKLAPTLMPPSAEAEFDFQRPPLSQDRANDMVILEGVIREDGSVAELKVLRGLLQVVDQAAMTAFSRWKFKPALRDTKPVAVQVLVGIPAVLPKG